MLVTLKTTEEVQLTHLWIEAPVRHEDEDIPYDFPYRHKDVWAPVIELNTGRIVDWPQSVAADVYLKVCDSGMYHLMSDGMIVRSINDYVPDFVPNEYGDYINLNIDEQGMITNWESAENVRCMIEEYLEDHEE